MKTRIHVKELLTIIDNKDLIVHYTYDAQNDSIELQSVLLGDPSDPNHSTPYKPNAIELALIYDRINDDINLRRNHNHD